MFVDRMSASVMDEFGWYRRSYALVPDNMSWDKGFFIFYVKGNVIMIIIGVMIIVGRERWRI